MGERKRIQERKDHVRVTAIIIILVSVMACDGLKAQSISQSSRPPRPDEMHRAVMSLGIGGYVAVTTSSGTTMRGHIRAIADDQLVPRLSRAPSVGKTLAIVGAVAYFGFMLVCSQPARC
jgi:hypothetical protein